MGKGNSTNIKTLETNPPPTHPILWGHSFCNENVGSLEGVNFQGCGIAMPDTSDSYIEPAGQVDFPG
jgi:hypothetical protein